MSTTHRRVPPAVLRPLAPRVLTAAEVERGIEIRKDLTSCSLKPDTQRALATVIEKAVTSNDPRRRMIWA